MAQAAGDVGRGAVDSKRHLKTSSAFTPRYSWGSGCGSPNCHFCGCSDGLPRRQPLDTTRCSTLQTEQATRMRGPPIQILPPKSTSHVPFVIAALAVLGGILVLSLFV